MRKVTITIPSLGQSLPVLFFGFYVSFLFFPFIYMVALSFQGDPFFTLENFQVIFQDSYILVASEELLQVGMLSSIYNTVIIAGASVLLSLLGGVFLTYLFFRSSLLKRLIPTLLFTLRFMPLFFLVMPLLSIYRKWGLFDTYPGLFLAYQIITLPLSLAILLSFFKEIPCSILEVSSLDGASPFETFFYVILPLLRPGLFLCAFLSFVLSWNQLLLPLILGGLETKTYPLALISLAISGDIQEGVIGACTLLTLLPLLFVVLFLEKELTRGLSMGLVSED